MSQLLEHERIKTTLPKAKELRRLADKMVSLGKKGTLHSKRQAERVVRGKQVMEKLFGEMAERYKCVANAVRVVEGTEHVKKNTSADANCATDVACCPSWDPSRERQGGYVRVLHAGRRNSDSAPMAFIEFVDRPGEFRPARPPRAMLKSFASSALPAQVDQPSQ